MCYCPKHTHTHLIILLCVLHLQNHVQLKLKPHSDPDHWTRLSWMWSPSPNLRSSAHTHSTGWRCSHRTEHSTHVNTHTHTLLHDLRSSAAHSTGWRCSQRTEHSTHVNTHTHSCTHTHKHTHAHAHTLLHARTHPHTHTHTQKHTHTHWHTCTLLVHAHKVYRVYIINATQVATHNFGAVMDHDIGSTLHTFIGLARTVHLHHIWPYARWFPC